jgi:hypothetical protein
MHEAASTPDMVPHAMQSGVYPNGRLYTPTSIDRSLFSRQSSSMLVLDAALARCEDEMYRKPTPRETASCNSAVKEANYYEISPLYALPEFLPRNETP